MKIFSKALLATVTAFSLVACGGGGGDGASQTAVVAAGTPISINATTGAAIASVLQGATFNFASAPPEFGISTGFTLGIGATTAGSPTFSLTSPGGTASGALGFGSCIFTINASTFKAPHPLAAGSKIEVKECSLETAEAVPGTGNNAQTDVKMKIGSNNVSTNSTEITIRVTPTGSVSLVTPTGTVVTLPVTVPVGTVTGTTSITGSVSN